MLIRELQPCLAILAKDSRGPFEAFTSFQKMGNIDQLNKEKGIPCRKKIVHVKPLEHDKIKKL